MVDNAGEVDYKVTPKVLEMHGGKVAVDIQVKYPEKYFNKKAIVMLTPVLKWEGGEVAYDTYAAQGESVEANNQVISFETGGTIEYSSVIDYQPEMRNSDLVITGTITSGDKSLEIPPFKVADGVLATVALADKTPQVILGADKFQRVIPDMVSADIMYDLQRYNIKSSELRKEEIKMLQGFMDQLKTNERIKLDGLAIDAYASPDGPVDLNEKVSTGRKSSASDYLKKQARRAGVETSENTYNLKATTEDWEGFKELVAASDLEDKDLILRVLSMHNDPEVREQEIKNMAATFDVLKKDILPQLRRSELQIKVERIGYSDDELMELVSSVPDTLNVEEILYAGTLTSDLNERLTIYQKASDLYADDWRTNNNLGVVQYLMENYSEAESSFRKALEVDDNDIVNNNVACVVFLNGDVEEAKEMFTASLGAGQNANYNLGLVNLVEGDYQTAVNYFGSICSANTGLAKMMHGDVDGALKSLDCVDNEEALVFYLKAVVGARNENEGLIWPNLRSAVAKDPALKAWAKDDLEFAKYADSENFTSIVE